MCRIQQWKKNIMVRAKSLNVHITELAGPRPQRRQISPSEGKPTVNAKSGLEVEKKFVHKPKPAVKQPKASEAAIQQSSPKNTPSSSKNKGQNHCRNCGRTGHNARTCKLEGL